MRVPSRIQPYPEWRLELRSGLQAAGGPCYLHSKMFEKLSGKQDTDVTEESR